MDLTEDNRALRAGDLEAALAIAQANADATGVVIALCALGVAAGPLRRPCKR